VSEAITLLLSQGPLGLVAGLFVYLYLNERSMRNTERTECEKKAKEQREKQADELDEVRQTQIAREREMAKTLQEYGTSVVQAIEQAEFLARELRRAYERQGR
jgi:hypothetical protein